MPKKVLIIDFDGVLLKPRPFDIAHKEWFRILSEFLRDQSINEHAFKEDYFSYVQEIMKRYLGEIDEKHRNIFARNIYAMAIVESVKKWDLIDEFAEYLRSIKKKYALVLVTSTPSIAVEPILQKIGCADLFDMIVKSGMEDFPSKKELLEEYIRKHGKPEFYIGKPDKDIKTCKDIGIRAISVNWVSSGENKGNFDVNTVSELDKVLERFRHE